MTHRVGYFVDLRKVELSDAGSLLSWIQAMPLGKYNHPVYGWIEFTPERIQAFANSVSQGVRGTDLDIDYDHKEYGGEAAGWIKEAEARTDGLYLLVQWTKSAWEKIRDGAYRYFSPEFAEEWVHPKTGEKFKDVLFGGGITNRPFLKDILPLNLSELSLAQTINKPIPQGGGTAMTVKKPKFGELSLGQVQSLAKALGLPDETSAEQVQTAIMALAEAPAPSGVTDDDSTGSSTDESGSEGRPNDKKLADGEINQNLLDDVAKLAEGNPAMKVMAEILAKQEKKLASTTAALRLAEAQGRITKLNEVALQSKRALPGSIEEELREILIDTPKQYSDKFFELMTKLAKDGFVELGELGRSYSGHGDKSTSVVLDERARRLMSQNKDLSYGDAVEMITREDPSLFDSYRAELTGSVDE